MSIWLKELLSKPKSVVGFLSLDNDISSRLKKVVLRESVEFDYSLLEILYEVNNYKNGSSLEHLSGLDFEMAHGVSLFKYGEEYFIITSLIAGVAVILPDGSDEFTFSVLDNVYLVDAEDCVSDVGSLSGLALSYLYKLGSSYREKIILSYRSCLDVERLSGLITERENVLPLVRV